MTLPHSVIFPGPMFVNLLDIFSFFPITIGKMEWIPHFIKLFLFIYFAFHYLLLLCKFHFIFFKTRNYFLHFLDLIDNKRCAAIFYKFFLLLDFFGEIFSLNILNSILNRKYPLSYLSFKAAICLSRSNISSSCLINVSIVLSFSVLT
jgi:hypothetical protein